MRRALPALALSLAALLGACGGETPRDVRVQQLHAVAALSDQDFAVPLDGGTAALMPVYANVKLVDPHPGVKRIVIAIQPPTRDAFALFEAAKAAASPAAATDGDTVVAVPQFLAQQDIDRHQLGPDFARWTLDGWLTGGATRPVSPRDAGVGVSSFAALDALLLFFSDRGTFPDATEILLVGHGPSARLVQLYAATAKGLAAPRAAGIRVRHIALSPDSYLYFDDKRPVRGEATFAQFEREKCSGFQQWPYGPILAPAYISGRIARELASQYAAADTLLVLGERDGEGADRSCEALAQGRNRIERADNHLRYVAQYIGGAPSSLRRTVARGADGTPESMYRSACVRSLLTGAEGC
jgi:hypothetical protein